MFKSKKASIIILITIITIILGMAITSYANTNSNIEMYDTDIANIPVVISEQGSKADVKIYHNFKNKSELDAFVDTTSDNLDSIIENYPNTYFRLNITLNKALTIEEFSNLVSEYSLNVVDFKIRAYDEQNDRITIGGVPTETELVPSERLQMYLKGRSIKGVIAFTCEINSSSIVLEQLRTDKNVYLANGNGFLVYKELLKQDLNIKKVPKVNDVSWYVEDYIVQ